MQPKLWILKDWALLLQIWFAGQRNKEVLEYSLRKVNMQGICRKNSKTHGAHWASGTAASCHLKCKRKASQIQGYIITRDVGAWTTSWCYCHKTTSAPWKKMLWLQRLTMEAAEKRYSGFQVHKLLPMKVLHWIRKFQGEKKVRTESVGSNRKSQNYWNQNRRELVVPEGT